MRCAEQRLSDIKFFLSWHKVRVYRVRIIYDSVPRKHPYTIPLNNIFSLACTPFIWGVAFRTTISTRLELRACMEMKSTSFLLTTSHATVGEVSVRKCPPLVLTLSPIKSVYSEMRSCRGACFVDNTLQYNFQGLVQRSYEIQVLCL